MLSFTVLDRTSRQTTGIKPWKSFTNFMTRTSDWTALLLEDFREENSNLWSVAELVEPVLDRPGLFCSFVLDGLFCWPSPLVRIELDSKGDGDTDCLGLEILESFGFLKRNCSVS